MVATAAAATAEVTPATAIANSGGLAGDCGFAYPLLVYWNGSFSVPLFSRSLFSFSIPPSLPLSLYLATIPPCCLFVCSRRRCRRPFPPSPLPSSLVHLFVVLPSTQSSRPSEFASLTPPRSHLPSRSPCPVPLLLSIYPPIYPHLYALLHCAIRADPRPRTQSPPVPGFYYEIRDSPGLVQVHPYSPPDGPCTLRTRRCRDIYWQTLRMSDHAGLRISGNIVLSYGTAVARRRR